VVVAGLNELPKLPRLPKIAEIDLLQAEAAYDTSTSIFNFGNYQFWQSSSSLNDL